MAVSEFWAATLRDIDAVMEGHARQETERLRWMRWQTAALLQAHVGKGKKLKPTDLFKLDDEKPAGGKVDEEKQREIMEKMDAYMAKKYGGG